MVYNTLFNNLNYKTMKKLSFILAAVAATLFAVSCNKQSSVTTDVPGLQTEIGFRPVGGMAAKSAINGTAFPQGYDMMVSAYRNVGSFAGEDSSQDYFEGIQFGYNDVATAWKSEKGAKYYPLDGTLDFLAVASAGYNNGETGIAPTAVWGESSNVAKKVVLTIPANYTKFDDLMYASANAQGISASGTPIEFHHAMTSVVFVAKCNVAYDEGTNAGITIDGITIDGAKHSGTLTVSNPSAGQGSGELSAAWSSLGEQQTHVAARVWNASNLGTNTSEAALANLNLATTAATLGAKPFGEGYVILPPQAAVPFTVTYTIHNGFASDGSTKLNKQVQYQYTPEGEWQMGKKNVYSLDFNLTEILINPTIVDWDAVEAELVPIPDPANGHAYVDLGLRVGGNKILFATMNIGASAPQEYGDYFAWGETSKRYTSISGDSVVGGSFEWSNCPYHTGSTYNTGWSKYIPTGKESYTVSGTADNKLVLDASDDVASALWGGSWRMPTAEELCMLINGDGSSTDSDEADNVTYSWTDDYNGTGVHGYIITGKGSFSSASLFLPAAGVCGGTGLNGVGDFGHYWSRSVSSGNPNYAWYLYFEDGDQCMVCDNRCYGRSVRPVLVLPE